MEIAGLSVRLDKIVHRFDPSNALHDRPHIFIYFITIRNESHESVRILGRRWILRCRNGRTHIVEGDGIGGEKPLIGPGESYSLNSFHMLETSALASGSLHGLDEHGNHILIRIAPFQLNVPE